jgi:carboxylesterase
VSALAAAPDAPVDVSPFDLGDAGSPAAALCLHGLTGTPYEVRPLGLALAGVGIRAVGPVLPGHDRSARELAATPYTEWLEASRRRLLELRARHAKVFAVGLSLGGLLALALSAEEHVDALVVVGTPLRLRPSVRWLVPVLKHVVPYPRKAAGSDIRDPVARRRHPSLPVMPLASVHELMRLQQRVLDGLPRIAAPILIAHGRHDATAQLGDAHAIHARVASAERELLVIPDAGHVVPVDHGGPRLAEAAARHLSRFA